MKGLVLRTGRGSSATASRWAAPQRLRKRPAAAVCGAPVRALLLGISLLETVRAAPPGATPPDGAAGQKIFAVCAACHAPDLPTRTGPDLRGVVGRKAGTVSGFRYSRALKNAGVVWNEATLDPFLAEPQAAFPGNAMPYPGLPDAAQRRDLIAYLKTLK